MFAPQFTFVFLCNRLSFSSASSRVLQTRSARLERLSWAGLAAAEAQRRAPAPAPARSRSCHQVTMLFLLALLDAHPMRWPCSRPEGVASTASVWGSSLMRDSQQMPCGRRAIECCHPMHLILPQMTSDGSGLARPVRCRRSRHTTFSTTPSRQWTGTLNHPLSASAVIPNSKVCCRASSARAEGGWVDRFLSRLLERFAVRRWVGG